MTWRRTVLLLLVTALGGLSGPAHAATPFPGARLGTKDGSSEYWDVTTVFSSGHRIFARFSISNEGPGDRTGYALGQIVFPDGRVVPFQNGRTESNWNLSPDRLRMEIGSSVLDLHPEAAHFEVDKNRLGIKFFLDYDPGAAIRSWSAAPAGYHFDLLTLAAPIQGTIWVRDATPEPVPVTGTISVTHAWMDETEPDLLLRRIESHLVAPDGASAYGIDVTGTKGERRRWLVVRRARQAAPAEGGAANDVWWESGSFSIDFVGRHEDSAEGYPIPRALVLAGPEVNGRIDLGRELLHHDPLSVAPRPFRWLLSFRTRPRQVWLESTAKVTATPAGGPFTLEGSGPVSFYFMNPVPDGVDKGAR